MPPKKSPTPKTAASTNRRISGSNPAASLPPQFKQAPGSLEPFYHELSPKHLYVIHVDSRPSAFKRKIFFVPVLMNVAIAALFAWRVWHISPYYWLLVETAFGSPNQTTLLASEISWSQLSAVVIRRSFTFMLDLCLAIFVWPWPVEFCFGSRHGNPVQWRRVIGFHDKEIYVRRSRSWYAEVRGFETRQSRDEPHSKFDFITNPQARRMVVDHITQATSPILLQQKTGYLTMDSFWNLDWDLMIWATTLVNQKEVALEAFNTLALLHHDKYGWLIADLRVLGTESINIATGGFGKTAGDDRRRQVLAFRDALAALDKEYLFFRWIEIIQFETSRPGGLNDIEQQAAVAKQVRDLFHDNNTDFDTVWRDSVGTESLAGI